VVADSFQDSGGDGLVFGAAEDRDLTLAFQRGEKGSYQAIYDRYQQRVHSVCRRILVNPEDAAEASQESFLKIYQALGRFNGRYQLSAWITRIATNVCLDHLRARNRRGGEYSAIELEDLESPAPVTDYPEEVVVRRWESRRVRQVLESLPPLHRAAIALRDFEGLSYEEVGLALGITDSQVKALLHRARQRFKRAWLSEIASIFVPWRFLDRVRNAEPALRDPAGGQVASLAAQTAPVCTSALQQCGQYLVDKVAPVLTAAVVGATAAGAAASPVSTPETTSTTSRALDLGDGLRTDDDLGSGRVRSMVARRDASSITTAPSAGHPEEKRDVPAPAATPTAAPTSSSTPGPGAASDAPPGGSDTAHGGTEGTATIPPAPPFTAAVGFERGSPIAYRAPETYSSTVDCSQSFLDQRLATVIQDGDDTYPVEIVLRWRPSGMGVWTTISKGGKTVTYPAAVYLTDRQEAGKITQLAFAGTYGGHPDADAAGLPQNGQLHAQLSVDCAASSVVDEALTYTVQS